MYINKSNAIVEEIKNILISVPQKQTKKLISEVISADRIFLVAIGRVNLSLQCFGKRLSHLGFKVELVGSLTEKPATKKDLLIVASGSGESLIPVQISKKAKKIGCKICHITSAKKSTIRKIADHVVELKAPTKAVIKRKNIIESLSDSVSKTKVSIQPMSTLFDQALHIYGDIVALEIIEKLKINKKKLWKYHANLE
tara:strand:+ start:314 stop:907 length:594 start_codon:yes stop_codon:yes gene_type:complete